LRFECIKDNLTQRHKGLLRKVSQRVLLCVLCLLCGFFYTIYIYKIGYRIRRYRQGLLEILDSIMPAGPDDIDVFELRKLQQYIREYIIFIVKMSGMKFGLKNIYNLYNLIYQIANQQFP
jgi:hypothetical protein